MQLISYTVLSSLVLAAATVHAAPSPANGNGNIQNFGARSGLPHAAHVARRHQRRAPHLAPAPFDSFNKLKRAANSTQTLQKKCRLRPTSSAVLLPTQTGTVAGASPSPVSTTSAATSTHSNASSSTPTSSSSSAPAATSSASAQFSSQWKVGRVQQGHSFFDSWDFWEYDDPTHGSVQFLNRNDALHAGLLEYNDGQPAKMKVSTQPGQVNRQSIRIHNQETFNINTLLLMDAQHMPTGCGTWSSFWSNGPNWPIGGEIDIVEGVNDQQHNQATLHTAQGCYLKQDSSQAASGTPVGSDSCGSSNGDNTGCGFLDEHSNNGYGHAFNDNGGGVYAMQWVDSGISIWFFPRGNIPADITAEHPMPWTWQTPFAHWAKGDCNPYDYFKDHFSIFDTTLCGDWAGAQGAWEGSGCRASTGSATCSDHVRDHGDAFSDAWWGVNYVKHFHQNA